MNTSPVLLLDSNVWVDAFDGERERHIRARALLDLAFAKDVALLYAVTSLKDVYYALSSIFKRHYRATHGELNEDAARAAEQSSWSCIENIQEIATPVAVDLSDVLLAGRFRSQVHDFEDALIAAAAMRCHADVLVTNDERFLRHCPVNAMDAADAFVYLTMVDAVPNT